MRQHFIAPFVIALPILALAQPPSAEYQQLDSITDTVAYAVYAAVVPATWVRVSKEELLLQQETESIDTVISCLASVSAADPEWEATLTNFKSANARARVLQRMLPVEIPYRLIPQAQLLADDTRLALKYPGTWQRRPESLEYAAVSAVGFNAAKTKAIVYVRLRSRGDLYSRELRDGKWVVVANRGGCGWIA